MKQIIKNKVIMPFSFRTHSELLTFVNNQNTKNIVELNDTLDDNFYCYVCYDSLTREKLFAITFSSDENEANLSLLVWDESQLLVVDTGKSIYFIDDKLSVKASYDITTPLVGLRLISNNKLLILEEASFRVINSAGKILLSELFDLIENFTLQNDTLHIETDGKKTSFDLG